MPSSSWVLALDEPPNQLRALPCANAASTSRGCTTPRSRTKACTSWACAQRDFGHAVRAVRGCISACKALGTKP